MWCLSSGRKNSWWITEFVVNRFKCTSSNTKLSKMNATCMWEQKNTNSWVISLLLLFVFWINNYLVVTQRTFLKRKFSVLQNSSEYFRMWKLLKTQQTIKTNIETMIYEHKSMSVSSFSFQNDFFHMIMINSIFGFVHFQYHGIGWFNPECNGQYYWKFAQITISEKTTTVSVVIRSGLLITLQYVFY